MTKDFYGILQVKHNADSEKIKRAYRRAAKRYHPDVAPKGEEKFHGNPGSQRNAIRSREACYLRPAVHRKARFQKEDYDSPDRVDLTSNRFDEIDHLVDYTEELWFHEPYRENKTEKRN